VHHTPEFEAPVYRATLDSGFSAEHDRYTADAATRAAVLALDVIATCFANPKKHTGDWASGSAHVVADYATKRDELKS
jgi:hypothetical protein